MPQKRFSQEIMSKAAVEELAALRIPVLREPDEKSVTEWIQDFETYQAQGGKRKPRECMSKAVRVTLEIMGARFTDDHTGEALSDKEVMESIELVHAPDDGPGAVAKVEYVIMKEEVAVDAAAEFVTKFGEAVRFATSRGDVSIPEKRLRKLFLLNIRPRYLAKLVEDEEPTTWKEAARRLVARTREASKMNDRYERMVRGAEDTKEPPKQVQRSARTDMDKTRRPDMGPLADGRRPADKAEDGTGDGAPGADSSGGPAGGADNPLKRCYRCGEEGHIKPHCPYTEDEIRARGGRHGGSATTRQMRLTEAAQQQKDESGKVELRAWPAHRG